METAIYNRIKKIESYKDPEDIKYVQTEIGKYRLAALQFYGLVRKIIFKQADEIENALIYALYC